MWQQVEKNQSFWPIKVVDVEKRKFENVSYSLSPVKMSRLLLPLNFRLSHYIK